MTYRFEIRDALNHQRKSERRRYDGRVANKILSEIERLRADDGIHFEFEIRGTF